MDKISPLGWAAIVLLVIIAGSINVWMIALLRNRDPRELNRNIRMPKNNASHQNLQNFIEVLRDPFKAERQDLQELSKRVEHLKPPPGQDDDD